MLPFLGLTWSGKQTPGYPNKIPQASDIAAAGFDSRQNWLIRDIIKESFGLLSINLLMLFQGFTLWILTLFHLNDHRSSHQNGFYQQVGDCLTQHTPVNWTSERSWLHLPTHLHLILEQSTSGWSTCPKPQSWGMSPRGYCFTATKNIICGMLKPDICQISLQPCGKQQSDVDSLNIHLLNQLFVYHLSSSLNRFVRLGSPSLSEALRWEVRGVWVLAGTGTESHDKFRKTLQGTQGQVGH